MPVIKAKEEEKDALKAKCIEEVVPKVFGALIKQLEKNGGSHFVGSEVHNSMILVEIRECTGIAAILYTFKSYIKHEYLRSRASTCLSLSSTSSVTSQIGTFSYIIMDNFLNLLDHQIDLHNKLLKKGNELFKNLRSINLVI